MPPEDTQEEKTPWKKVAVQDDFLLGLTEPGFQDLEILDTSDYSVVGDEIRALIQRADEAAAHSKEGGGEDAATQAKPKKKKKKKAKSKLTKQLASGESKPDDAETHVDDLLARVSALEAENDRLRQATGTTTEAGRSTPPEATAAAPELDMSAWEDYGLDDLVISSLAKQKFTAPTDIQHECLPAAILGNADIVGAAQTGSGKTLAFGLPIINYLVKEAQTRAEEAPSEAEDDPESMDAKTPTSDVRTSLRALILCPTRELALQVADHLSAIAKPICIRVAAIVGGISVQKQARLLRYRPPIVVATPGRLWDLMRSGAEHVVRLRHLAFLVLDEADRMVARGHYEEVAHILSHIPKPRAALLGSKRGRDSQIGADGVVQTVSGGGGDSVLTQQATLAGTLRTYVFSATLTLPDGVKARLQRGKGGSKGSSAGATLESLMEKLEFRGKPKVADLTADRKIASKVVEAYATCSQEGRDATLYYLLSMHPGRTLVFLNTISNVRRVAAVLKTLGIAAQVLHAQQQQRQRLKALARFRADASSVLVATDVAARGLDVPNVDMVVQYQLPPTADTYIHRAGRTARAGAEGACVSLVVPGESARFSALHTALNRPAPQEFPVDTAVLADVNARVRLAQRVDELERTERKETADNRWRHRNAEAIGVDLDEGPSGHEKGPKVRGMSDAKLAKKLRGELQGLLAQPLRQRMNSKFFTGGTSQAVAKSLAAAAAPVSDIAAAAEDEPGAAAPPGAVVHAAAMQASVAEAQRVVKRREPAASGGAGSKKRKQKVMSMAEHQAAALHNALTAKRLKKAKKAAGGAGKGLPLGEGGQGALAAIRAASSGQL